jgi:hypothetical protein
MAPCYYAIFIRYNVFMKTTTHGTSMNNTSKIKKLVKTILHNIEEDKHVWALRNYTAIENLDGLDTLEQHLEFIAEAGNLSKAASIFFAARKVVKRLDKASARHIQTAACDLMLMQMVNPLECDIIDF